VVEFINLGPLAKYQGYINGDVAVDLEYPVFFFGIDPQTLFWAASWVERVEVTVSGISLLSF